MSQLDAVALRLLHRDDPIEREALDRIVREPGVGLTVLDKIPLITAPLFVLAIAVVLIAERRSGAPWDMLLRRAAPLFYLLILPFVVWGGAKRKRFTRTTEALLRHRRCPHCGYDLSGLPADPDDGATVCPECGCAWPAPEAPAST